MEPSCFRYSAGLLKNDWRCKKTLARLDRRTLVGILLDSIFLAMFAYVIGVGLNAWAYLPYPRGADAINQLQKVKFILQFWPHISWDYQWSGGMPLFRWYPSLFYYIVSMIVVITGYKVELVMVAFLYAMYVLCAIGVYALMVDITKNRTVSLFTSSLVISSPSVWDQFTLGGVYSRVPSLMLLPFAMLLVKRLTENSVQDKQSKKTYIATILLLAAILSFNPFLGWPSFLLSLLIPIWFHKDFRRGIRTAASIAVPVLLVNSYFYIPFLYHPLQTMGGRNQLRNYLLELPSAGSYMTLAPVHVALTISFLGAAKILKVGFPSRSERGFSKFFATLVLLSLAFVFAASFLEPVVPFGGLVLTIVPFFLMPLAGIALHKVIFKIPKLSKPVLVAFLLVSLVSIQQVPGVNVLERLTSTTLPSATDSISEMYEQLKIPGNQTLHRVGIYGADGYLGQWWNYKSDVPQTRDYFFQGILYPDWIAWLHSGVWERQNNYEETNFLLDWWAVKWIIVNEAMANPHKFFDRPDYYQSVANISGTPYREFIYRNSTSIIGPSNVPTVLVIGPQRTILNVLAYSNYNSRHVIPIHGKEYLDDYSLDELKNFDGIIMYGYNYRDLRKAWTLLAEYVQDGGGLIIDTGLQYAGSEWNASDIMNPIPVERTIWRSFGKEWRFSYLSSPVTDGVNFALFSPAESGKDPWFFSSSLNESIRDWARPVLWSNGHPVVVLGSYGKGRVVWSGLNLPWHIMSYKNNEESMMFAKMVEWSLGTFEQEGSRLAYEAERITPEKVLVNIQQMAKGVLYKEFYFKDWRAYLEENGKRTRELQIYQAGPDFMYVAIPQNAMTPVSVAFEFTKLIEYTGLALSAITIVALIMYAIKLPVDELTGYPRRKLSILIMKVKN